MTEFEVRAMIEKATAFEPNVVEGRFMIHVRHLQHRWIVANTIKPFNAEQGPKPPRQRAGSNQMWSTNSIEPRWMEES